MSDPYNLHNLQCLVDAFAELRASRKRGHWMWFVSPQIGGLGASPMVNKYAISSRAEAEVISTIRFSGRGCANASGW